MPLGKSKKHVVLPSPSRPAHKWKFRFEKWAKPMVGIYGTIRTVPENYYVAEVRADNRLLFTGIERKTRSISKATVRAWWKLYRRGR